MIPQSSHIESLIQKHRWSELQEELEKLPDGDEKIKYQIKSLFLQGKYTRASSIFTHSKLSDDETNLNILQAVHSGIEHITVKNIYETQEKIIDELKNVNNTGSENNQVSRTEKKSFHYLFYYLGNIIGWLSAHLVGGITSMAGKWIGYSDQIWTNWYRKPIFIGILILAYMRNVLNKKILFSTYDQNKKLKLNSLLNYPGDHVKKFRTINGTFNNLDNPIEGAAGTRFQRNASPESSNVIPTNKLYSPNPRTISRKLLSRKGEMKEAPFINMIAAAWIQFQNHDWVSHPDSLNMDMHEIELSPDDPARKKYHQDKLFIPKTPADPFADGTDRYKYNFINEVTHWWDGSQIYGSDEKTAASLRSFDFGKLKQTDDGLLPTDKYGHEQSGYIKNWWLGLSLFHTLFVSEHNAICDALVKVYTSWSDHQLYHTARLINAALMAKIHTIEWNSAINPNEAIFKGNHSNWYGLLTILLRKKENWRTIEEINIRNTELGGVVGNPINKHGGDFGLTQEFVEAYRIHSMLPEKIMIKNIDHPISEHTVPFENTRYKAAHECIKKYGIQNLWYSLGMQHPGQVILHNYPKFMQELSIPGNPVYDMGTVDILRARERGVPRYNEFRRQLGLNPVTSFEDLTDDMETINELKEVYGIGGIEDLDLMIGTLAETHRPKGFAFGETMFQLFLLNATRRLQADRFYTDCYKSEYYTEIGMKWIDTNTLKSILMRHYPELEKTGLRNITNAFEPWDEELPLNMDRHPLMKF